MCAVLEMERKISLFHAAATILAALPSNDQQNRWPVV
jgi:hypothetical protein